MYIPRHREKQLQELLSFFPVVVLIGARQVGKSTMLKNMFPNYDYVVFDSVLDIENARKEPDLFLQNHTLPIILDEIQYAQELLSSIKRLVDTKKTPGQFIITGSQQWSILKSLSESLAGRAVILDLYPFSLQEQYLQSPWLHKWLNNPKECLKNFNQAPSSNTPLSQQLFRGFFADPQLLPLHLVSEYYASYITTYIDRDLRAFTHIQDLHEFGRFFQILSALSGQEIHYSHLGREIGITPQTAKRWISLLQGAFLWQEVPPFLGNTIKRISSKPKGYIMDTGILCHALRLSSPESVFTSPHFGAIFESAVYMDIYKQISLLAPKPQIFYWRTHSGSEVDIVLEYNNTLFPIEIKATSHPKKADVFGINTFKKTYEHKYNIAPGLLIAASNKGQLISDDILSIPWDMGLN